MQLFVAWQRMYMCNLVNLLSALYRLIYLAICEQQEIV